MLKRENYLKKIRPFASEFNLIKIIYGHRRCGKSVILAQIIDELKEKGIKESNIIYISFESIEYNQIKNEVDLYNYIKENTDDTSSYYVFLDEIQKIENFELALNSLRILNRYSIFITGSNSKLTFIELSTELSGRYVSFKINPLSFKEVTLLKDVKPDHYYELLLDIFKWGTLPQRFNFDDELAKKNYILDIFNSIVLNDVIDRTGIKDITTFNKIFQYILETTSREFSAINILEYLSKNYKDISSDTLYNYLEALCSTFLISKVNRYDVSGKQVLKTLNKFYVTDLGIKNIKSNQKEINFSSSLEILVYNELIIKGYDVYIGKTKKGEIDFIAEKMLEKKYIQVSYTIKDEGTREREFSALSFVKDNFGKIVITTDTENFSKDGIVHINIFDFLLNEDF